MENEEVIAFSLPPKSQQNLAADQQSEKNIKDRQNEALLLDQT